MGVLKVDVPDTEKTSCLFVLAEVEYPKSKQEKSPSWTDGGSRCRAWSRRALCSRKNDYRVISSHCASRSIHMLLRRTSGGRPWLVNGVAVDRPWGPTGNTWSSKGT